jgi:hypothetical protein
MHCNLKQCTRRTTWQLAKQTMTRGCDVNSAHRPRADGGSRAVTLCMLFVTRDGCDVARRRSPTNTGTRGVSSTPTPCSIHFIRATSVAQSTSGWLYFYSTMQCTGSAVIQTRCVSKTLQRTRYVDPIASKEKTPAEFTGHRHSQRRYPRKYRRPRSSRQQRPTRESVKTI